MYRYSLAVHLTRSRPDFPVFNYGIFRPITILLHNHAETGFGSADLREPSAARTKLFPNSHIGPGNLRHSVRTSSNGFTNISTSFSPMISGGRIFITSIA